MKIEELDPQGPRITWGKSGIEQVRCPCCGVVIRTLSLGDTVKSQRLGDMLVVHRVQFLATLANYREFHAEMEDPAGNLSKHVASICTDCALNLTPEIAQLIFESDKDTARSSNTLAMRIVTRILDVNEGGVP